VQSENDNFVKKWLYVVSFRPFQLGGMASKM